MRRRQVPRRPSTNRLAGFPIVIPPLRDRREDIPTLTRHLLHKHAERVV